MIGVINGIDTGYEELTARVDHIANTYEVACHGIYNPTHNKYYDLAKCYLSMNGYGGRQNSTVRAIQEFCIKASGLVGSTGKILLIPHSKGCMDTYFALQGLPKSIRQQIEVVAIAPALVIPKAFAGNVVNYASKGLDYVVLNHYSGVYRGIKEGNLTFLPRAPGTPRIGDHSYNSPTFSDPKDSHFTKFTKLNNCRTLWKD
ncbi:MAG: hypothetical protein JSR57_02665 [Verrucomicrobia bacterium]|nr:hypothetical protein [Verrucomicrobiota bacterium]